MTTDGLEDVAATEPPPRGILRLALDPGVGRIFWAKLWTGTGMWVHGVTAAIVVFAATHSTFMVGLVGASQFIPVLILTPWAGKLADKGHLKQQMIAGRALCVLGSGSLAAILLALPDLTEAHVVPVVFGSSLLAGLGLVFSGPAMQAAALTLVNPRELSAAMALNSAPETIARVVGPMVGAVAYTQFGPLAAFGMATIGHGAFMAVIATVDVPRIARSNDDTNLSVLAAVKHVIRDRPTLLLLLSVAIAAFGADPALTLAPAIAHSLDRPESLVGLMSAACGIGSIVGLLASESATRAVGMARTVSVGLWLMATGLVSTSLADSVLTVGISFVATGVGFALTISSATAMLQVRSPISMRGRIMALWLVGFAGVRPIGASLIGAVADQASVAQALQASALVVLVTALICRPRAIDDSHLDSRSDRVSRQVRLRRGRNLSARMP